MPTSMFLLGKKFYLFSFQFDGSDVMVHILSHEILIVSLFLLGNKKE
jgi:hypothetical protein